MKLSIPIIVAGILGSATAYDIRWCAKGDGGDHCKVEKNLAVWKPGDTGGAKCLRIPETERRGVFGAVLVVDGQLLPEQFKGYQTCLAPFTDPDCKDRVMHNEKPLQIRHSGGPGPNDKPWKSYKIWEVKDLPEDQRCPIGKSVPP